MTALHWAARQGWPDVVNHILAENPLAARAVTHPHRAPGTSTALMCLLEGDWTKLDRDDALACIDRLVPHMAAADFAVRSTPKGQTVFHLGASRGNVDGLERLCARLEPLLGKKEFVFYLN